MREQEDIARALYYVHHLDHVSVKINYVLISTQGISVHMAEIYMLYKKFLDYVIHLLVPSPYNYVVDIVASWLGSGLDS